MENEGYPKPTTVTVFIVIPHLQTGPTEGIINTALASGTSRCPTFEQVVQMLPNSFRQPPPGALFYEKSHERGSGLSAYVLQRNVCVGDVSTPTVGLKAVKLTSPTLRAQPCPWDGFRLRWMWLKGTAAARIIYISRRRRPNSSRKQSSNIQTGTVGTVLQRQRHSTRTQNVCDSPLTSDELGGTGVALAAADVRLMQRH